LKLHISYRPAKGCKHPELTYGEICIQCGECGRYDVDFKCVNCGYTEGKKPFFVYKKWGSVEFIDVFAAPICPMCRPLFKDEDKTQVEPWWNAKEILCCIKDFRPRYLPKDELPDGRNI